MAKEWSLTATQLKYKIQATACKVLFQTTESVHQRLLAFASYLLYPNIKTEIKWLLQT